MLPNISENKKMMELVKLFAEREKCSVEGLVDRPLFEKQIFLGAGHIDPKYDISGQRVAVLFYLLEKAVICLSGMQQNGGMGYEFDEQSDLEDKKTLSTIVMNISNALKCR